MIPDEAVEAAARASFALTYDPSAWGAISVHIRLQFLEEARASLEAAAPFIAAQAWDEGMNDAWNNSETMQVSLQALRAMNPYREAEDTGNE